MEKQGFVSSSLGSIHLWLWHFCHVFNPILNQASIPFRQLTLFPTAEQSRELPQFLHNN
jgi:hypothetical protein